MTQYNAMPLPGPYIPPTQGTPAQTQGPQQTSSYQPNATSHGAQYQSQKGGGTFGQMMNQRLEQAVTTGKPMLNKLGKTISSKLGTKPLGGPPQHLQSYQSYQTHYGQQNQTQSYQQPQGQAFSPQSQQQQWGQPQQQPPPQAPNVYASSQQSPYQQSNYSTTASGHSGQSNYFPQQTYQAPTSQPYASQSPLAAPGHTSWQHGQGGGTMEQAQVQTQGQNGQGQPLSSQPHAPVAQQVQGQSQYTGQQAGIVGGSCVAQHTPPPHTSNMSPGIPAPPMQPQWEQAVSPTYPPRHSIIATSPPVHAAQQQWNSPSPVGAQSPHSASPPPAPSLNASPRVPPNKPVQSSQTSTPISHHAQPYHAPTEFIAELPADLGSLTLAESKAQQPESTISGSQYQAFHPLLSQTASPSPGFTIPRRSLSVGTIALADPWRFVDAVTEVPTREFYILADLLFDALDRKFEPKNTGLLEAPKIIGSWVKLTEDACRLFSYRSYSAFAKLWSLEGIPHIMVPCQSNLTPNWNFNQHSHAQDARVMADVPTHVSNYTTYMPALNRAGWYKFFFLEMMHAPDDIGNLLTALCADTYRPGVLNHPDLNKRDKTEVPALQARAAQIQTYAMGRVCEDTKAAMAVYPDALAHAHQNAPASGSAQTGAV